jgi:hypothetical protein
MQLRRYAPAFNRRRRIVQPDEAGFFRNHKGLVHHNLRAVDITGFDADLASLELVLYILDKARALQRMSLQPIWKSSDENIRLIQKAIARYIAPAVPSGSCVVLQLK